jgi:hypothetical protein
VIQQRAEGLVALIRRQRELRGQIDRLDGFRTQAEVLRNAAGRLGSLLAAWRLFRRRGIGSASVPPEATRLLVELEQLRTRFREEPTYVLGPNRLAVVRNEVPTFAKTLEQQLLAAWRAYTTAQAPAVNPEVLTMLRGIGALRPQVDRVSVGLRDLAERANRVPTTEADIDQFGRKAAEVSAAWGELDSGHLPAEVLSFLKDAGSPMGADLNKLTEPVRQWLRDHDLTGAFRIRQTTT